MAHNDFYYPTNGRGVSSQVSTASYFQSTNMFPSTFVPHTCDDQILWLAAAISVSSGLCVFMSYYTPLVLYYI